MNDKFIQIVVISIFLTSCSTLLPEPTSLPLPTATSTPMLTQTPTLTPTLISTPTPLPKIGSTLLSPKDGMTMVYVPSGFFSMGTSSINEGVNMDEIPQHQVFLDAFWIDQTEVTNAMYAKFLNESGNQEEGEKTWLDEKDSDVGIEFTNSRWAPQSYYYEWPYYDYISTANFPASEVTWYGANAYCQWAGKRLPTEAEWEKAARGTEAYTYPWGNENDICAAKIEGCGWIREVYGIADEVGQWPEGASPYYALDMLGSVWEWTSDWYDANYYDRSPAENPQGPEQGKYKSIRGSSRKYSLVQITKRSKMSPELSNDDLGFRCVMDDKSKDIIPDEEFEEEIITSQTNNENCSPGNIYIDDASDNNINYMDILKVETFLAGEMLTTTFYVQELPSEITVNQEGLEQGDGEYAWVVDIDADDDPATGGLGHGSPDISGIDYAVSLFHSVSGEPIVGPIESLVSADLWQCENEGCSTSVEKAKLSIDYNKNTITLIARVPGISENSILYFTAYRMLPSNIMSSDYLCY